MTETFATTIDTTSSEIQDLVTTHSQNPFYTLEYITYRRSQGFIPWLLSSNNITHSKTHCLAFMKIGRLRCSLEIPSAPDIAIHEPFWQNLSKFCKKSGITDLSINSFCSPGGIIPNLGHEKERKTRWEFLLDLKHPVILDCMSKHHIRKIKLAQKYGIQVRRVRNLEAAKIHADLISMSMQRRKDRGENVSINVPTENICRISESKSGEFFQAVLANKVVSSYLILLAEKSGYYHSGGTNPKGMDCGASHFLVHRIASTLRDEGKEFFNLGGTDDPNPESGLVKFKTGFGPATERRELQAARFTPNGVFSGFIQRLFASGGK